jgi:hypothetical protein
MVTAIDVPGKPALRFPRPEIAAKAYEAFSMERIHAEFNDCQRRMKSKT